MCYQGISPAILFLGHSLLTTPSYPLLPWVPAPGRLIQDSLGGNCRTRIIATLSPTADCVDESISTLKFADRAKQVRAAGGDEQAIPSLVSLYSTGLIDAATSVHAACAVPALSSLCV